MKKVIIVHGWGGNPNNHWFPSVADSLKQEGFQVEVPEMPNTNKPEMSAWVNKLTEIVPKPNRETYFIGHSIGCQAILRYLDSLKGGVQVGKIVLVAPYLHNALDKSIDFEKVKRHISNITAIFSDNDEEVSLSDKEIFKALLDAKIIVEHNKGHFTEGDNVIEFPLVVKEVVTI